ncbi:hypothetical protein CPB86DRAFT_828113 [Serendipita vermifera]|nr:hypothetical protein CPB86DRAFT_828113 [Serendipita vermifera]
MIGYIRFGNQYITSSFQISMDGNTQTYYSRPVVIPLQNNHIYRFEAKAVGLTEGLIVSGVDWVGSGTTSPGTTTDSESSTTTHPATETTAESSTSSTTSQTQTSRTSTSNPLSTDLSTTSRLSPTTLSTIPSGLVSPPPYTGTFGDNNSTLTSAATEGSTGPSTSKVVGAVFGTLIGLTLCVFAIFFYRRRRARNRIPPSMAFMNYRSDTEHPPAYPFSKTFFRQRASYMGGGSQGMNKYGIAPSDHDIAGGNTAGWGAAKEYQATYPNSPSTAGRYGGYGTNGVGYGAAGVGAVAATIGAGGRHLSTLDEKSSEGSRTPSALVQTTPVPDSMFNAAPGLLAPVDARRPSASLDARRLSAVPDMSLAVVNGDPTSTPPHGAGGSSGGADGPRKLSVDTTADIARTLTPPSTAPISDPGSPAGGNHNGTGHLNGHGKLSQAQQAVLAGLEQHAALLGVESPSVLGTETPAYSERHAYDGMEIYSPVSSAVTLSNRHSGLPYTMPSPPMPLTGLPPLPSHNPNNNASAASATQVAAAVTSSSSPLLTGPPNIPLPPTPTLDTSVTNTPYSNQSNNPFRTPPAQNSDSEVNLAGRGANGWNHAA